MDTEAEKEWACIDVMSKWFALDESKSVNTSNFYDFYRRPNHAFYLSQRNANDYRKSEFHKWVVARSLVPNHLKSNLRESTNLKATARIDDKGTRTASDTTELMAQKTDRPRRSRCWILSSSYRDRGVDGNIVTTETKQCVEVIEPADCSCPNPWKTIGSCFRCLSCRDGRKTKM